jgi:hypothetical protein
LPFAQTARPPESQLAASLQEVRRRFPRGHP